LELKTTKSEAERSREKPPPHHAWATWVPEEMTAATEKNMR